MKRNFVVGLVGSLVGFGMLFILLSAAGIAGARGADMPRDQARPGAVSAATPLTSTFTYQGQLKNGGNAVNGSCDMAFRLYDALSSGNLIGSPIIIPVQVTNGLFTVGLNFGDGAFDGNGRWLDIQVNCGSGFTQLTPRQALTPAPYALAFGAPGGVYGYLYDAGAAGLYPTIGFNTYGAPYYRAGAAGYGGVFQFHNEDGSLIYYTGSNVAAGAAHAFTGRFAIQQDGRVGIGTTTPCSGATLHVYAGNSGLPCAGAVFAENSGSGIAVYGASSGGYGVYGASSSGFGVYGGSVSGTAVFGASSSGTYIFEGWDVSAVDRRFAVERATGNVLADGSFTSPADFAEMMTVTGLKDGYTPGDVLVIGPDGKLALSDKPNAVNLAGVYSAKPGFLGDTEIAAHGIEYYDSPSTQERIAVALLGIVPVKVTAENGQIQPGDLLTTSSTPGHAMKAKPVVINGVEIYPTGTILGKALEPWEQGTGVIKVLVTLR